jgi:hypothetical protein
MVSIVTAGVDIAFTPFRAAGKKRLEIPTKTNTMRIES